MISGMTEEVVFRYYKIHEGGKRLESESANTTRYKGRGKKGKGGREGGWEERKKGEEGGEGISLQAELYPEAVNISGLGGFSHPPCPQGVFLCN